MDQITVLSHLLDKLIKLRSHYMTIIPRSPVLIKQIDEQIELTFNKIKHLNK